MKISIVGVGYVGLSIATLLAKQNEVFALDLDKNKVDLINKRISPFRDDEIENHFKNISLNLTATTEMEVAYNNAEYIVIATPTDYNIETNNFDTSSVETVLLDISKLNNKATIIIKSTVPVGFTDKLKRKYNNNIIFSPEFLREGKALYDNLYPSRIVVGQKSQAAIKFVNLLLEGSMNRDTEVLYTESSEAEAIKLFSNSYLAMRIAFFNELDTYAETKGLNSFDIIKGVGLDSRIGSHYNNPSFGYGGYCLPKDTKQLLANYKNVPQSIIKSIVESNNIRKLHISKVIIDRNPKKVGIYRLVAKTNSDNFRDSAIQDIINLVKEKGIDVIIYEPLLETKIFNGTQVENNFEKFIHDSDVIVANRQNDQLKNYKNKVYTRDIFSRD
jgi:UDPglucose 6-dehydrogenase